MPSTTALATHILHLVSLLGGAMVQRPISNAYQDTQSSEMVRILLTARAAGTRSGQRFSFARASYHKYDAIIYRRLVGARGKYESADVGGGSPR